jgi:general secretion pathway protein A
MYEQFFGLKDKPFSLTPNTRFVYASTQYAEVESHLLFGIRNREALMVVTGRPGTGKTTLCRALVERLRNEKAAAALIVSPFVSGRELLSALLTEFGVTVPEDGSYHDLLDRLTQFVLAKHALGKVCVALIDEAQHLPAEALEQIRILTNLETEDEKLIQIVLAGQPELLELIGSPRLAHLDQRISIRCTLGELDETETGRYVHHRLTIAGADGDLQLGPRAMKELHRGSHGVPRLINLIADRALLAGFAAHTHNIDAMHVRKALAALRGEDSGSAVAASANKNWRRRFAAAVGFASIAVAVAGVSLWSRLVAATPGDRATIEHVSQANGVTDTSNTAMQGLALATAKSLEATDTTAACSAITPQLTSIAATDSVLARRLAGVASACTTRSSVKPVTAAKKAAVDSPAEHTKRDEVIGAKP